MAGIYIHIPFCRQACYYCDFYFTTSQRLKQDFLAALIKEAAQRREYTEGEKIRTIYFGGGTPSQLNTDEIRIILEHLHVHFDVAADAEITLEANPDDLAGSKTSELKSAGINRLSIGVQSFFEEDLKWMNRAHDAAQALRCIKEAQNAGLHNISMDLIYGLPQLSPERWQKNLEIFYELNIPHLSAYSLTVENNTPLEKLIRKGDYKPVHDATSALHFDMLMEQMKQKGWLHYEISNFARNAAHISRHNSAYWKDELYLGLGPSAHSYNRKSRQWNLKGLQLYIDRLNAGTVFFEEELLTVENRYNEFIMTRLRTTWGIKEGELEAFAGKEKADTFRSEVKKFIESGQVEMREGAYVLTSKGKMHADQIASALFIL